MNKHLKAAERAARAGGAVLLDWSHRFAVREKGPCDLVTEADLASQHVIRDLLLAEFPDHAFLGEEGGDAPQDGPFRWICDPLDGTTNYVHQVPQYAVSLALEREGKLLAGVVYDPVSDECYTAACGEGAFLNGRPIRVSQIRQLDQALAVASFPARVQRGAPEIDDFVEVLLHAQALRRTGSAALNLCYVASGRFDSYWATETKIWDVAAGFLIMQEAGGIVTDLSGEPYSLQRPRFVASSTAELHREMLSVLQRSRGKTAKTGG